jgi:hypothetical protein
MKPRIHGDQTPWIPGFMTFAAALDRRRVRFLNHGCAFLKIHPFRDHLA